MIRWLILFLCCLPFSTCVCASKYVLGPHSWPAPHGRALPFASHREVLDFLRSARIISKAAFKDGVNLNWKIVLEKSNVRAQAILRWVNDVEDKPFTAVGGRKFFYRDSYLGELAAYELNRLLHMDNLPPTVLRQVDGKVGTLQLWLDGTMTEYQRLQQHLAPPDLYRFASQIGDMRVFDNLINNTDRHPKNHLIDFLWKVWLIDHTRAFGKDTYLPQPDSIIQCSQALFQALLDLKERVVRSRLQGVLSEEEIEALWTRRGALVALLRSKPALIGARRDPSAWVLPWRSSTAEQVR